MGQYLSVGIAKSIYIQKEDISKKDLIQKLERIFEIQIYNLNESEHYYILTLKENVFEKNITDLLTEFKTNVHVNKKEDYDEAIKQVQNKKYKEINQMIMDRKIYKLQYLEGCWLNNDISYIFNENNKEYVKAFCDIITIEEEGKVFFECYNYIFTFLRNMIIKNLTNPLKNALVITIIG